MLQADQEVRVRADRPRDDEPHRQPAVVVPPQLRGALGGAAGVERAIGAAGISGSGIYHNANLAIVLGWKGLCSCWDGVPALLNVLNLRSASVLNIKQRISAGFTGYHLCRVSISMWGTGSPTQTCCMWILQTFQLPVFN